MPALFISDLHIDATRPHILAGWQRLLATLSDDIDALYILGDLVEVWVGDDDDDATAVAIRDTLHRAAERRAVHVMHGNRDFLFGERFAAETGVVLLEDPTVIDVDGERVLIAHGDAYCTRDAAYQEARKQLRSKAWQDAVLAMGLTERRALAAGLRARSIAANENKAANIMDVTPEAVDAAMDAADVNLMVHGHTHRPAIHVLGGEPSAGEREGPAPRMEGRRRIVLGDWHRCGWKLTLASGEADLSCFALP